MTTSYLAAIFKLCLARRALDEVPPTMANAMAKYELDQTLAATANVLEITVDSMWAMFESTGARLKEIVDSAQVRPEHNESFVIAALH